MLDRRFLFHSFEKFPAANILSLSSRSLNLIRICRLVNFTGIRIFCRHIGAAFCINIVLGIRCCNRHIVCRSLNDNCQRFVTLRFFERILGESIIYMFGDGQVKTVIHFKSNTALLSFLSSISYFLIILLTLVLVLRYILFWNIKSLHPVIIYYNVQIRHFVSSTLMNRLAKALTPAISIHHQ